MSRPEVYYFGCWPGSVGHYIHDVFGTRDWRNPHPPPLQAWELDGKLCPKDSKQTEGEARLVHHKGWTVLAFWDRSEDKRYDSNSAFLAEGTLTFEEMVALAHKHFPKVMERTSRCFPLIPAPEEEKA